MVRSTRRPPLESRRLVYDSDLGDTSVAVAAMGISGAVLGLDVVLLLVVLGVVGTVMLYRLRGRSRR